MIPSEISFVCFWPLSCLVFPLVMLIHSSIGRSAFKLAEELRLSRLNQKLKQSALKPRALTDKEEYERKQQGFDTDEDDEQNDEQEQPAEDVDSGVVAEGATDMQLDAQDGKDAATATAAEPTKVSTSGPRLSRREQYRTDKRFQVRLPSKTVFRGKGEKKRMGCKPKRRR